MKVFVTGATGFVGSAVIRELMSAGHSIKGLVRSNKAAEKLRQLGVTPINGSIDDLDVLEQAASTADGVIHTAFIHGLSQASLRERIRITLGGKPAGIVDRFQSVAVDAECRAIDTFGSALLSRKGALVIALPTMALRPGRFADEDDSADPHTAGGVRARSEQLALAFASKGLRSCIVRLPPSVHDKTKLGLVSRLTVIARKKGISAFIGKGDNRWAAVHRLDAARLFRFALETGEAGCRYHAVAENMSFRVIAEAIGHDLGTPVQSIAPEQAARHFGWLAPFVSTDNPVSSRKTQERLSWSLEHPELLADLAANLGADGPR